jgi:DNA-binding transcriptional LysR family regulator
MEIIEIEAFLAISDTGSFTKAARRLHISQPAISRRIDLLEMDLGAPLFLRGRSGARLTPAGEAFLPFARTIIATVRDGINAVKEVTEENRGDLLLAIVGTLASTNLLESIRTFRREHRSIRLRLHTANSKGVSQLVRSGDSDLGLRYFADSSGDLENHVLGEESIVLVRAVNSTLLPDEPPTIKLLSSVPWVGFPIGSGSSGEPFAHEIERTRVRLGIDMAERITIDSLTAQKRMIEADFGIGMLPESSIVEEQRLGTLEIVDLPDARAQAPIVLVSRKDGFRSRAMETLISMLTANHPDIPATQV